RRESRERRAQPQKDRTYGDRRQSQGNGLAVRDPAQAAKRVGKLRKTGSAARGWQRFSSRCDAGTGRREKIAEATASGRILRFVFALRTGALYEHSGSDCPCRAIRGQTEYFRATAGAEMFPSRTCEQLDRL